MVASAATALSSTLSANTLANPTISRAIAQPTMKELPLRVKLPLLMSLVLAGTVGVALLATYGSLRRTQLQIVEERLTRATRQLATLGASSITAQHTRFLPVAN